MQAFAPASGRRAEKQARRNVEKDQTRLHVPLVDRTFGGTSGQGGKEVEGDVPPVIIAVMGPSGVSLPLRDGRDKVLMAHAGTGRQDDAREESGEEVHEEYDGRHQGTCHGRHRFVASPLSMYSR
jgi:hypothetical protein